jgi:hypothetical protein
MVGTAEMIEVELEELVREGRSCWPFVLSLGVIFTTDEWRMYARFILLEGRVSERDVCVVTMRH